MPDFTPAEIEGAPAAVHHYTPHEIADMLQLSVDTVRGIFSEMPGVVKIERPRANRKARPYVTLRIPADTFRQWYNSASVGWNERKPRGRKAMKPRTAWGIASESGRLIENNSGTPIMRATQNNPCDWLDDGERFVRVRIIEDAAAEKAISCLRRIKPYAAGVDWSEYEAAIRGLGGKG